MSGRPTPSATVAIVLFVFANTLNLRYTYRGLQMDNGMSNQPAVH